ncbi:hypothetical protein FJZ26_00010 [Candidatus Parvarchaeota archaeon]|nr:hypothetical protein [Candidatus Parvarchaeota archaeon]
MLVDDILDNLDILGLDVLLGHEQTIPKNEVRLREAMLNIGRLVDPLIVDKENHVVLDGNHRLSVLRSLHCINAACQVVDYKSTAIGVGSWFPTLNSFPEKLGALKCDLVDLDAGLLALENKEAFFMAVVEINGKKKCCLYESSDNSLATIVHEQQDLLKKIDKEPEITYIEDTKAADALNSGKTVLYRKIFSKAEIVGRAKEKLPLPPKSTRHTIPDRIIRLNVPLGWLTEVDLEEAKQNLTLMIKKRAVDHAIRRYTEPVLVIY